MRKVIIISALLLFSGYSFGQYTSEDAEPYTDSTAKNKNPLKNLSFKQRLYTGGNLSFGTYNNLVLFLANPIVGYRITPKFSAGLGAKYIYYGPLFSNSSSPTYRSTIYGGSIFSRYMFTDRLFAHGEFELLNTYNQNPNIQTKNGRALAKMFMAGLGYSNRFSANFSAQIMVLYDFINDINSPYKYNYVFGPVGPPIIYRIGFIIGL